MPRAGLTEAVVISRAADLADELGWEHLTLAALAARLGVAVPSLYKHVDGLDGVRRGITRLALGELRQVFAEAAGWPGGETDGHPRDGLRALATAQRAYAETHPGRYASTVRAARPTDIELGEASAAVLAIVLAVLRERGLEADAAIDAARAFRAAVHGFITLEALGGFGLSRDVDRSFDGMVSMLERGLVA